MRDVDFAAPPQVRQSCVEGSQRSRMTSLYTQDSSANSTRPLFLWLFVPPLCLAHWWEGMEIIQDLGRYGPL